MEDEVKPTKLATTNLTPTDKEFVGVFLCLTKSGS